MPHTNYKHLQDLKTHDGYSCKAEINRKSKYHIAEEMHTTLNKFQINKKILLL